MKKYTQITLALAIFFALVWWRNHQPSDEAAVAVTPKTTVATPLPTASMPSSGTPPMTMMTGRYRDGNFTGNIADAFYGNVQVKVTVNSGTITDVSFLQYPNDNGTSRRINSQAMPLLRQQVLQAQSAQVDGVTGASATSSAFVQSLDGALQQAK